MLDVFKKPDATHDKLAIAGEMFVLKLYNVNQLSMTFDELQFVLYMQKMKTSYSSFPLESLPPTSAALKYHAYRAYYAVQEWLGNGRS